MPRRSGDPAIAERIAAAVKAAGQTHGEIALQLPSRDERYVYEAVKGIRGLRPQDIAPLARALSTTSCALLGDGDHGMEGRLPGWSELTPEQQALIRQNVAMLASTSPVPSLRAAEEAGDYLATPEPPDGAK